MPKIILGVKGSSTSGNRGHAGRPGKVGGSAPKSSGDANWSYAEKSPYVGAKLYDISPEDRHTIDSTLESVYKMVGMPPIQVAVGMLPVYGSFKLSKKDGTRYISVDTKLIDSTLKRTNMDLAHWFATDAVDHASILEHVIAHECGHAWMSSIEHSKPGTGTQVIKSWEVLIGKHPEAVSGYGRSYQIKYDPNIYTGSPMIEAFCDQFARFATGLSQPSEVEEWMLKWVK